MTPLEQAKSFRDFIDRNLPEARQLIGSLRDAGLIEGWRNVTYCGPPRDVAGVTGEHMILNPTGSKP